MELTPDDIGRTQEAWRKRFRKQISDAEAREWAHKLMELYGIGPGTKKQDDARPDAAA